MVTLSGRAAESLSDSWTDRVSAWDRPPANPAATAPFAFRPRERTGISAQRHRRLVDADPFRPFRIRMSDGTEHLVDNPNLLFVTKHTVVLGILDEGEELPERSHYLDTIHVTQVELVA